MLQVDGMRAVPLTGKSRASVVLTRLTCSRQWDLQRREPRGFG